MLRSTTFVGGQRSEGAATGSRSGPGPALRLIRDTLPNNLEARLGSVYNYPWGRTNALCAGARLV